MKIGFLFPGQGAQIVGMGKDLYDNYKEVRDLYSKVKEYTGVDIESLTFDSTEEELNQTKNTQICILTMSLAILKLLEKEGIKADISLGLSLGEYSALIYSKVLDIETGTKLVRKRGEYMQDLVPEGRWSMAAIMGLDEIEVENVCKKVTKGFVVPVNYNTPKQIVISGEKEAVEEAEIIAKEAGAKKVRVLKTSGPFHTEKLIEASNALRKELENIKFGKFETEVIKNLDGDMYRQDDDIKDILANHIISPVRFSNGLKKMIEMGVDTFIEVGPGKTLSGFVKRIETDKEIRIFNINDVETLKSTVSQIKNNN